MAVPAIKSTLQDEILRILREDIAYQVQDGDNGVTLKPSSIIWRPTRAQKSRSFEISNQLNDMPGIILSNPRRTPILTTGGTVNRDEWHYLWMAQLLDNDLWEDGSRIRTWDKWIEQIASAFMYTCMNGVVVPPAGQVKFASATIVSDIDENIWIRDGKFIMGVEIEIQVLQNRGIIV